MPVFSIVKLLPLGAVDDLMDYCTQLLASCYSASGGLQHLQGNSFDSILGRRVQWCIRWSTVPQGNSFDYTTNRHDITVYHTTTL